MDELENFLILLNKLQEKNKDLSFEFLADSRKIKKGDVFVALVGEKTDGHFFINDALLKGASLVIAQKKQEGFSDKIFYTADPIGLIKKVCMRRIKEYHPLLIGITGSCGKTSTKAILYQLLKKAFPVFVTKGNANSQIGLPLALMDLRQEHKIAILEIGMSQQHEILKQVEWIPLEMAIITSIGLSHVENFKDGIVGIAKAKGEILAKNKSVQAFFNDDTLQYEPFLSYLFKNVYPKKDILIENDRVLFNIDQNTYGPYPIGHFSQHMLENLHLALACALKIGVDPSLLKEAILELKGEEKRLEIKTIENITFIDDSYNASPSSMQGALHFIQKQQAKRKIACIGSMKELGEFSKQKHQELAVFLNEVCHRVFCIGKETLDFKPILQDKMAYFEDLETLKKAVVEEMQPEDLVLLKGSHSTGLFQLFEMIEKQLANK